MKIEVLYHPKGKFHMAWNDRLQCATLLDDWTDRPKGYSWPLPVPQEEYETLLTVTFTYLPKAD